MTADLSGIRHAVLDLDGTLYKGSRLFPCTVPFLQQLTALDIEYSFVTNNSSQSRADYCSKLQRLGVPAHADQIYTSAAGAMDYIRQTFPGVSRLALLGTPSLCDEFVAAGFVVDWATPEAVVVAFDTTLDYQRLCRTAYWIQQGLPFIATHPDLICPTDQPTVLVDCGAVCAALSAATGRHPVVLGKPSPVVLQQICSRHGLTPDQVVMVGDRLYTDMAMARSAGCVSVLVLTGEATRTEATEMYSPPDLIVEDVGELGIRLSMSKALEVIR